VLKRLTWHALCVYRGMLKQTHLALVVPQDTDY
jgi:hypothetical protein